jgi:hypothetical protein
MLIIFWLIFIIILHYYPISWLQFPDHGFFVQNDHYFYYF